MLKMWNLIKYYIIFYDFKNFPRHINHKDIKNERNLNIIFLILH